MVICETLTVKSGPTLGIIDIPLNVSVRINASINVSALCKDTSGNGMTCPALNWSINDTSIAQIVSGGTGSTITVKGLKAGTTNLDVNSSGIYNYTRITVPEECQPPNGVQRYCQDSQTICVWNQVQCKYDCAKCSTNCCKNGDCVDISFCEQQLGEIILPSSLQVPVNQTTQIVPTCKDKTGNIMTCPQLTWQSSNTNILTVDQNGNVTGKNPGTANVQVSRSPITNYVSVTILPGDSQGSWFCENKTCTYKQQQGGYPSQQACVDAGCLTTTPWDWEKWWAENQMYVYAGIAVLIVIMVLKR